MPPSLFDVRFGCTFFQHEAPATCLNGPRPPNHRSRPRTATWGPTSPTSTCPPASRSARRTRRARHCASVARPLLAVSLALLIAAVWLLWDPAAGATSLAGAAGRLHADGRLRRRRASPSGPEIAGAICFSAALLRLGRDQPPPAWLWWALGAGGCVLAAARALGPAFALLALVSVAALVGPGRLARADSRGRQGPAAAGAAIAVAAAASLVWEFAYQPRPSPSRSSVLDATRSIDLESSLRRTGRRSATSAPSTRRCQGSLTRSGQP